MTGLWIWGRVEKAEWRDFEMHISLMANRGVSLKQNRLSLDNRDELIGRIARHLNTVVKAEA